MRIELPRIARGWGTIVVDPPWSFSDKGSRATGDYPVLSEDDICSLPIGDISAPQSHLYCWSTDSHLASALIVVDAWGFDYKHLIVWVKRDVERNPPGPLQIGMGHYYRKAHEVCIFATKGKAKARVHSLPGVIESARGRHSAKPELLQDRAELLSPGPYLELFARRYREGWFCWGNELA